MKYGDQSQIKEQSKFRSVEPIPSDQTKARSKL